LPARVRGAHADVPIGARDYSELATSGPHVRCAEASANRQVWAAAERRGSTGPLSVAPEEMAPGLSHRALEADLPDVDVRHCGIVTLLAQIDAPPSNPGGGLVQFCMGCPGCCGFGPL
jgi:hypothetical protein